MIETLFALVVLVALPVRAWRRYQRSAPPTPTARYLLETLLLIGVLAVLLWRREVPLDAIGLRPESVPRFLVDLVVCVGVVVGLDLWSFRRQSRRIRRAAAHPALRASILQAPGGACVDVLAAGRGLWAFVAVTSVGAVWEELCFRATVFLLVPATPAGVLLGIVGGSLAFGAQHLRNGPSGMAYPCFFGVLFSLLYLATGDLVAVIVAHAAGNILAAAQWAPRIERARQAALQQAPMFLG